MLKKLKIKLIKKSKKCVYIVASRNKKIFKNKIGTIFLHNGKKFFFINLKSFLYWINKGALYNNYVYFFSSILFIYCYKKRNIRVINNVKKEC